jgi:potassium-transporting ATPase KdpC subunit
MRTPSWISQHWAALRLLLVLTVLTGIVYPLVITGIAQIPGLQHKADGSLVKVGDTTVGSSLIGQAFIDAKGNPLVQYFQTRPSDAGTGYDPTATSASNLGPENVVDTLPNPADPDGSKDPADAGKQSLLTQVCGRSLAVGTLEGVSGARPYCTPNGVGAVLVVVRDGGTTDGKITAVYSINEECPTTPFISTYDGVAVQCGKYGVDYTQLGFITPIRGDAPANPAVPSDAVTASGSGLDPQISPAYADLQAPRVAKARGVDVTTIDTLIKKYTVGRGLGFMGAPAVDVLQLNVALDQQYPYHS